MKVGKNWSKLLAVCDSLCRYHEARYQDVCCKNQNLVMQHYRITAEVAIITLTFVFLFFLPCIALAQDHGIAVYGGKLTEESWEQSLDPGVEFADVSILAASASWTFHRSFEGKLSFELEANVAKHFGDQDHFEFNLPVLGFRWHRFPWDNYIATSFAWGIGSSYATEIPEVENQINEDSKKWLIYWFAELTFGAPEANWEVLARLHHRSDGFGALNGGGSNALCAGFRYRF